MDLKVVKQDDKKLLLEIKGEGLTLPNLVREELWKDDNVDEAAYIKEHPQLSEPKIFVSVKRGEPVTALKKASNRIVNQIVEFREQFKKALK
jgi:DNA-directed RNA polymerase subunit L